MIGRWLASCKLTSLLRRIAGAKAEAAEIERQIKRSRQVYVVQDERLAVLANELAADTAEVMLLYGRYPNLPKPVALKDLQ